MRLTSLSSARLIITCTSSSVDDLTVFHPESFGIASRFLINFLELWVFFFCRCCCCRRFVLLFFNLEDKLFLWDRSCMHIYIFPSAACIIAYGFDNAEVLGVFCFFKFLQFLRMFSHSGFHIETKKPFPRKGFQELPVCPICPL